MSTLLLELATRSRNPRRSPPVRVLQAVEQSSGVRIRMTEQELCVAAEMGRWRLKRVLRDLERAGLVASRWKQPAGRPVRLCAITPRGRDYLAGRSGR